MRQSHESSLDMRDHESNDQKYLYQQEVHPQDWGLELTMVALLVAAFLAVNVISLVLMLFLAMGMGLPQRPRRFLWRAMVLPALGLLLIWQYGVLLGWPPFVKPPTGKRLSKFPLAHSKENEGFRVQHSSFPSPCKKVMKGKEIRH